MSTTLDEKNGVYLTRAAIHCQRCGNTPPGYQLSGPNGYVQICSTCVALLARLVDAARIAPL